MERLTDLFGVDLGRPEVICTSESRLNCARPALGRQHPLPEGATETVRRTGAPPFPRSIAATPKTRHAHNHRRLLQKFVNRIARMQVHLCHFDIPSNGGEEVIKVVRNSAG